MVRCVVCSVLMYVSAGIYNEVTLADATTADGNNPKGMTRTHNRWCSVCEKMRQTCERMEHIKVHPIKPYLQWLYSVGRFGFPPADIEIDVPLYDVSRGMGRRLYQRSTACDRETNHSNQHTRLTIHCTSSQGETPSASPLLGATSVDFSRFPRRRSTWDGDPSALQSINRPSSDEDDACDQYSAKPDNSSYSPLTNTNWSCWYAAWTLKWERRVCFQVRYKDNPHEFNFTIISDALQCATRSAHYTSYKTMFLRRISQVSSDQSMLWLSKHRSSRDDFKFETLATTQNLSLFGYIWVGCRFRLHKDFECSTNRYRIPSIQPIPWSQSQLLCCP